MGLIVQRYAVLGVLLGFLMQGACAPKAPSTHRGKWYYEKRQDLIKRTCKDKSEAKVNKAILMAADKLARAVQRDYYQIDVSEAGDVVRSRESKKKVGVIDIYRIDQESGQIRLFDSYVTDFLIAACMSNEQLGENFSFVERYKLQSLLREYDLRAGVPHFDPLEAIKQGKFKGVDAILTGNIYVSKPEYRLDPGSKPKRIYKGGVKLILRLIDIKDAEILGNAAESIDYTPLLSNWLDTRSQRF
jgi:hypothetical protein